MAPDRGECAAFTAWVGSYCGWWEDVAAAFGVGEVMVVLACEGAWYGRRRWLAPDWPYLVEEFIRRLGDPSRWNDHQMVHIVRDRPRPAEVADLAGLRRLLLEGRTCSARRRRGTACGLASAT